MSQSHSPPREFLQIHAGTDHDPRRSSSGTDGSGVTASSPFVEVTGSRTSHDDRRSEIPELTSPTQQTQSPFPQSAPHVGDELSPTSPTEFEIEGQRFVVDHATGTAYPQYDTGPSNHMNRTQRHDTPPHMISDENSGHNPVSNVTLRSTGARTSGTSRSYRTTMEEVLSEQASSSGGTTGSQPVEINPEIAVALSQLRGDFGFVRQRLLVTTGLVAGHKDMNNQLGVTLDDLRAETTSRLNSLHNEINGEKSRIHRILEDNLHAL